MWNNWEFIGKREGKDREEKKGRWAEGEVVPNRPLERRQVLCKWFYSRQAHLGLRGEKTRHWLNKDIPPVKWKHTFLILSLPSLTKGLYLYQSTKLSRPPAIQKQKHKPSVKSFPNKVVKNFWVLITMITKWTVHSCTRYEVSPKWNEIN